MRCLFYILLIAIFVEATVGLLKSNIYYELASAIYNNRLESFLNNLKPMLKTGNESLEIPTLDPLEIEYQNFSFLNDAISITGNFVDVRIDGLSDYNIDTADFKTSDLKVKLNMTWSNVKAKSFYSFDAELIRFKKIPIYGKGDGRLNITNLTIDVNMTLAFQPITNQMFVKHLSTRFSVDAVKFVITGLYNNEVVSRTASTIGSLLLQYIIKNHQYMIKDEINNRLIEIVNVYLSNLTLLELISIIFL